MFTFFSWPNNVLFCARILHFLYLFIYQLTSRLFPCSACCEYCCSTSLHGVVISCGYLPQVGRPDRSWAGSVLLLWICHNSQRHVHSQTHCAGFSSCPCYHLLILVLSLGTCWQGWAVFHLPSDSWKWGVWVRGFDFGLGLIWFEVISF